MSKGYFTFAQYSEKFGDYPRMAYALALSLKASQTRGPTDLTVGMTEEDLERLPKHYLDVFNVEVIPWTDEAVMHNWKLQNEWKVYHMTPYDETIKLDADMLFSVDINHVWQVLGARSFPVAVCDKVYTYRNEIADTSYYRKAFKYNNFYNAFSALTYFRKSNEAQEFYRQVEDIYHYCEDYAHEFMRHKQNDVAYTDEVYGMAIKTLQWDNLVHPPEGFGFVHLKSKCQHLIDYRVRDVDFTDYLDANVTDTGEIYINNYLQTRPLHYTVKHWCDDNLINKLEKLAGV